MSQKTAKSPTAEFIRQVRSALAHLYDHAHLQNHPLVALLELDVDDDKMTRAQNLRNLLLEAIEMLRAEGQGQTEAGRAYTILTYRYVDGLSMPEVIDKLVLSRRQVYREHRKGVEAVASLLWNKSRHAPAEKSASPESGPAGDPEPPALTRLEMAQAEIDRLQKTVQLESLDAHQALSQTMTMLKPLIEQTPIRIDIASPPPWPPVVADRVMLRQVLLNLLSYALERLRSNLVVRTVEEKQGLRLEFCEQPQTGKASSLSPAAAPKRSGVGLTVARALAETQDGRLEVFDEAAEWRAHLVLPTSRQALILAIDDNEDIVALLKRYLGGYAISVVGVSDGREALQLAAELQPQLITLDVMMPNQDGWEVLQWLKSSPDVGHIPMVVCSILNEPQLAQAMGASDYLTKPVDQTELLAMLQRHLGVLPPSGSS